VLPLAEEAKADGQPWPAGTMATDGSWRSAPGSIPEEQNEA
jgi:hypothetical protein